MNTQVILKHKYKEEEPCLTKYQNFLQKSNNSDAGYWYRSRLIDNLEDDELKVRIHTYVIEE